MVVPLPPKLSGNFFSRNQYVLLKNLQAYFCNSLRGLKLVWNNARLLCCRMVVCSSFISVSMNSRLARTIALVALAVAFAMAALPRLVRERGEPKIMTRRAMLYNKPVSFDIRKLMKRQELVKRRGVY